jgi:phosphoglycerate dehydrogenase-like enzyme
VGFRGRIALDELNLLISFGLPAQYVERIRVFSPRVRVQQSRKREEALALVRDVDILLAGFFSLELFKAARRLKWIQTLFAGVDRFLYPEVVKSSVVITSASGVNSIAVSEHVIGMMLCLNRKLHLFMRNQTERKWKTSDADLTFQMDELSGKTAGLVGLGHIGSEIAKRAKCLGMRVVATRRDPSAPKLDYVDKLVPLGNLEELLADSDFVIIQIPLTRETEGMFGEKELRRMKRTAYLVNASRGKIVKEDELIEALRERRIAGAALDTFSVEPLPEGSPLWSMRNVILTPHVAGLTPRYMERLTDLFCDNLRRFMNDEPLINVVDKSRGY